MDDSLRVMTYNLRYHTPDDGADAWPRRRDAVAATIRFHAPDVIGVQEPLASQLDDLRTRLSSYTWVGKGRVNGHEEGEFAAIGYDTDRLTCEYNDAFWLSETPAVPGSVGWDADHPRVVTQAEFTTPDGRRFAHFNTHLDHHGERARLEGARLLRERLADVDVPAILTGDLNCTSADPPYRHLAADDGPLSDARNRATHPHHGPDTTKTDFESLTPDMDIDHVFVTDEWDVDRTATLADLRPNGRFPSDHLPVAAVLDC